MLELDLNSSLSWEQIHFSSRDAPLINPYTFQPLDAIPVDGGILRNAPIIATYAQSTQAKPHWRAAGYINQTISTGIALGGSQDTEYTVGYFVALNRIKLHFLNPALGNYGLKFYCKKYLRNISITVWQYTGAYTETLQQEIQVNRIIIRRIEDKVNDLFGSWNN